MLRGYWRHHEVFDGTYTLDDLLDIHEIIDVQDENEARHEAYEEMRAGRG